jgi:hypothetical protein
LKASALAQLARERHRRCEIALHVRNVKSGEAVGEKIELREWLDQLRWAVPRGPATALVHGLAGSGKSSALTSAAEVLWQECDLQKDGAVVPIFVSLPALRDPVTMAVEETLEAWGFSRRNIEELLRSQYRFVIPGGRAGDYSTSGPHVVPQGGCAGQRKLVNKRTRREVQCTQ